MMTRFSLDYSSSNIFHKIMKDIGDDDDDDDDDGVHCVCNFCHVFVLLLLHISIFALS